MYVGVYRPQVYVGVCRLMHVYVGVGMWLYVYV